MNQDVYKKRDTLYKELKDLELKKTEVEKQLDNTLSIIENIEERNSLPKVYYHVLDKFVTAEELIEYQSFFNKKEAIFSTELTSLI